MEPIHHKYLLTNYSLKKKKARKFHGELCALLEDDCAGITEGTAQNSRGAGTSGRAGKP